MHCPEVGTQRSSVQPTPSSHCLGAWTQRPLDGSQESVVHRSWSSHWTGLPTQATSPAAFCTQWSSMVQASASLPGAEGVGIEAHAPVSTLQKSEVQGLPSSHWIGWLEQAPVSGSQVSTVQGLPSSQAERPRHTGVVPPGWKSQKSPWVQASPSLQVPPAFGKEV